MIRASQHSPNVVKVDDGDSRCCAMDCPNLLAGSSIAACQLDVNVDLRKANGLVGRISPDDRWFRQSTCISEFGG